MTTRGAPLASTGYGGGLYMVNARGAVSSNVGSIANNGAGGGIYMWGNGDGIQVQSNQVISNSARTGDFGGWGAAFTAGRMVR